eukprot:TRINITY_DN2986_c0_g1_i4.p1 TRINITY_DN2986_c0_g1~~TRINITY_DN2986_c0_g1_i4.p1  ORF type:complete len:572 (-),score=98.45 TRINITY_DN2986_c0_g1_i4:270-1985(-)
MDNSDIVNLIYQFLLYEGLQSSADVLRDEVTSCKLEIVHTPDVRLITVLKLVMQWTERLWELSMKQVYHKHPELLEDSNLKTKISLATYHKVLVQLTEQLDLLGLLQNNSSSGVLVHSQSSSSIWEEPRTGNIIYEDTKGTEITGNSPVPGCQVRAATLNKLIEELTPITNQNNTLVSAFLLTYPSFTTAEILFSKLKQRYNVPRDPKILKILTNSDQTDINDSPHTPSNQTTIDEVEFRSVSLPIQLRVINFLKLWVENSYTDLTSKQQSDIKIFVESIIMKDHPGQAKSIIQIFEKQSKNDEERPMFIFDSPPPMSLVPRGLSLFLPDIDWMILEPLEIARQITLIEFELFYHIRPIEFLNQAWSKAKLRHKAPNLLKSIDYFNRLSTWVSSKILSSSKLKQRAKVWVKFITIAEHLYEHRNFNSLMAVLSGLSNATVHRLKVTRSQIPNSFNEKFVSLQKLMDPQGGYALYRSTLQKTVAPCIPYLAVSLSDLTLTEDGNPDTYNNLINFTKCKLIGNIINGIRDFQKVGYNLQPVYQIQAICKNLKPSFSEEEQIKYSYLREPKHKK